MKRDSNETSLDKTKERDNKIGKNDVYESDDSNEMDMSDQFDDEVLINTIDDLIIYLNIIII